MTKPISPPSAALLQRGLEYWQGKRGARRMPARRDIDPIEIPDLLPNIVLVDVERDPLDFRYRLIGTAITAHLARDYTGTCFSSLPHQQPGSRVWETGVRVLAEKEPIFSDIPYVGPDRWVRGYGDLYMPLSENDDDVNMIFGVVQFETGLQD
jgi:hypothetical protein